MITRLRARIIEVYGSTPQNHIADSLSINRGRLSQYATGTRAIPVHHLIQLAEALQVEPSALVGYCEMEEV